MANLFIMALVFIIGGILRLLMSHQNVMPLARPLEREGFLQIRNDPTDRRARRLHLTREHFDFWSGYQERSISEIE